MRWAHASELIDPVPYMEGGELLLITALKLDAEDAEATRTYVRRVAGAGVVGLGFAVGVNYEGVPDALVEAARQENLPLLGVPRKTPFIAISKAVSAAVAADQYRAVTAGFEAQRELTRAALGPDGPAELLARLAAHLDGWAALYDASGAVVAAAPDWAARRAARLSDDVGRLRERPAPASSVVSDTDGDDRVELQSLGTGRRARGVLAVGTGAPLGTAERYAVHSAVALLTLTTERSRALQDAEQRLGAAVLKMLLAGEPEHARAVAGRLYGGLLDAPFRVVIAEPVAPDDDAPAPRTAAEAPAVLDALADAMDSAAARTGEAVLAVPDTGRLTVLVAAGGAAEDACSAYAAVVEARSGAQPRGRGRSARTEAAAGAEGLAVGLSAPTGPAGGRARPPPGPTGAVRRPPPRSRAGRARGRRRRIRAAAARRRRRARLRRRAAARPARPRRDGPRRPGGIAARLAVPARSVGRRRRRPGRPPAHPALPHAAGGGDPGPLPRRRGRPDGAVAGAQGDVDATGGVRAGADPRGRTGARSDGLPRRRPGARHARPTRGPFRLFHRGETRGRITPLRTNATAAPRPYGGGRAEHAEYADTQSRSQSHAHHPPLRKGREPLCRSTLMQPPPPFGSPAARPPARPPSMSPPPGTDVSSVR